MKSLRTPPRSSRIDGQALGGRTAPTLRRDRSPPLSHADPCPRRARDRRGERIEIFRGTTIAPASRRMLAVSPSTEPTMALPAASYSKIFDGMNVVNSGMSRSVTRQMSAEASTSDTSSRGTVPAVVTLVRPSSGPWSTTLSRQRPRRRSEVNVVRGHECGSIHNRRRAPARSRERRCTGQVLCRPHRRVGRHSSTGPARQVKSFEVDTVSESCGPFRRSIPRSVMSIAEALRRQRRPHPQHDTQRARAPRAAESLGDSSVRRVRRRSPARDRGPQRRAWNA